jgi:hypothetical protein
MMMMMMMMIYQSTYCTCRVSNTLSAWYPEEGKCIGLHSKNSRLISDNSYAATAKLRADLV